MSEFVLTRAHRSQARLRMGISSVSGGGKTMGALRLARGLVEYLIAQGVIKGTLEGKIAVIDTERKSASLYADVVPFDVIDLGPPYSVDRYQQALGVVEQAGYVVCIIDQVSHAWAGPGGQLEWVDTLKMQAKNPMSPWMKVTPVQQEFYDRMLRSPMHIIATTRAKSDWVIEEVVVEGRTKKVPRKIGLQPVQREGFEYEMTTMLDVDLESHMATASKDRTRLFDGRSTKLDEECGRVLGQWLMSGAAEQPDDPKPEAPKVTDTGAGQKEGGSAEDAARYTTDRLESVLSDLELSFIECATLPELAAQFAKGQGALKPFAASLGTQVVVGALNRLITAKDKRKAALAAAAGATPGAEGSGGATGPAAGQSPAGGSSGEPAGQKEQFLGPDDVVALEKLCTQLGISIEDGRAACGVDTFSFLPLAQFAIATDKLNALAESRKAPPAAKKPRKRAEAAA